jgi:hypothetical protein
MRFVLAGLVTAALTLTASLHPETTALALDGQRTTRWATGRPQTPGDWLRVDLRALEAGLSRRRHICGIYGDVSQLRQVDQHDPVAQMRAGPAVSARPHRDLAALVPGEPHGTDHVVLVLRPNNHRGKAAGGAGMPNRAPACLFVACIGRLQQLSAKGLGEFGNFLGQ